MFVRRHRAHCAVGLIAGLVDVVCRIASHSWYRALAATIHGPSTASMAALCTAIWGTALVRISHVEQSIFGSNNRTALLRRTKCQVDGAAAEQGRLLCPRPPDPPPPHILVTPALCLRTKENDFTRKTKPESRVSTHPAARPPYPHHLCSLPPHEGKRFYKKKKTKPESRRTRPPGRRSAPRSASGCRRSMGASSARRSGRGRHRRTPPPPAVEPSPARRNEKER